MSFERWTQPKPQVPEFKIVRHTIQITKVGTERVAEIAPKLADAQRVALWWDASAGAVAITPTEDSVDSAAVKNKNGVLSIPAKGFFEFAGLQPGFTPASAKLESHDDGVMFIVGSAGKTTSPRQTPSVKKTREVRLDENGNPIKRKYTRRNQAG